MSSRESTLDPRPPVKRTTRTGFWELTIPARVLGVEAGSGAIGGCKWCARNSGLPGEEEVLVPHQPQEIQQQRAALDQAHRQEGSIGFYCHMGAEKHHEDQVLEQRHDENGCQQSARGTGQLGPSRDEASEREE